MKARYRVHKFPIHMYGSTDKLEQFLNNLEGDLVAIIPNVATQLTSLEQVDFLLIIERVV